MNTSGRKDTNKYLRLEKARPHREIIGGSIDKFSHHWFHSQKSSHYFEEFDDFFFIDFFDCRVIGKALASMLLVTSSVSLAEAFRNEFQDQEVDREQIQDQLRVILDMIISDI